MKKDNAAKIHIVEDDELLLLVLSQGFKKEGYEVVTDSGLDNVSKRIETSHPDLLILDVNLPNNSGLQILELSRHYAHSRRFRGDRCQCP
jgi:DNA-binding response OmpR family regulator